MRPQTSKSHETVPLIEYCVPLRPLPPVEEPDDRDEIRPLMPPLPFRVTPGLRATVGNKPARASATRATAF